MLGGRFGVGLVRGYQARWVDNFRIRDDVAAVGPWNKDTQVDADNRDYFAEYVDLVVTALTNDTFSHQGKFWTFAPADFVNPHDHPVYRKYGQGVDPDMAIREIGIAPRPLQKPHPPPYGGFTHSMRTALFWARYRGKPIVLSSNLEFYGDLCRVYRDEAAKHGHDVALGEAAGWGGIMICAPTDAEAQEWMADMRWFWNTWSAPFGQGLPELLVGAPDTISRRIEEAARTAPIEDVFLLIPQGLHSRDQIMTSLELFSTKVMSRFATG